MKRFNAQSLLDVKKSVTIVAGIVVILFAVVLVYSVVDRFLIHPAVRSERAGELSPTKIEKLIQVSVRNECGAKDIAMNFTSYLRRRGFDVVEAINGSTPDRAATTVVDAAGNYQNALRVAEALGVGKQNVVTKIDPRSYVDVEVLIGRDYQNLSRGDAFGKTK